MSIIKLCFKTTQIHTSIICSLIFWPQTKNLGTTFNIHLQCIYIDRTKYVCKYWEILFPVQVIKKKEKKNHNTKFALVKMCFIVSIVN